MTSGRVYPTKPRFQYGRDVNKANVALCNIFLLFSSCKNIYKCKKKCFQYNMPKCILFSFEYFVSNFIGCYDDVTFDPQTVNGSWRVEEKKREDG